MASQNDQHEFKLVYLDTKTGEDGDQFEQSFFVEDVADAEKVGKDLFRRMQSAVKDSKMDKSYTFIEIRPA